MLHSQPAATGASSSASSSRPGLLQKARTTSLCAAAMSNSLRSTGRPAADFDALLASIRNKMVENANDNTMRIRRDNTIRLAQEKVMIERVQQARNIYSSTEFQRVREKHSRRTANAAAAGGSVGGAAVSSYVSGRADAGSPVSPTGSSLVPQRPKLSSKRRALPRSPRGVGTKSSAVDQPNLERALLLGPRERRMHRRHDLGVEEEEKRALDELLQGIQCDDEFSLSTFEGGALDFGAEGARGEICGAGEGVRGTRGA